MIINGSPLIGRGNNPTPRVTGSQTSAAASGTAITVAFPSYSAGDLLLFAVAKNTTNSTITTPSGWTLLRAVATTASMALFCKVATGSEGSSVVVTGSTSTARSAVCLAIAGLSGNQVASPTIFTSASTSVNIGGVTITTLPALLIAIMGRHGTALTLTEPTGFTEIEDYTGSGSTGMNVSQMDAAATGATGSFTGTASASGATGCLVGIFE